MGGHDLVILVDDPAEACRRVGCASGRRIDMLEFIANGGIQHHLGLQGLPRRKVSVSRAARHRSVSATWSMLGLTPSSISCAAAAFSALTGALFLSGPTERGVRVPVVEFLHPPGFATPRHIHHRADEAFYVLSGSIHGFAVIAYGRRVLVRLCGCRRACPTAIASRRAYRCVRWRLLCRVDSTHSSLAWVSLPSGQSCLLRSSCPTSRFSSPLLRPMGKRSSVRHQNGPRREARRRRRQVIGPQKCCVMRPRLPRGCDRAITETGQTSSVHWTAAPVHERTDAALQGSTHTRASARWVYLPTR